MKLTVEERFALQDLYGDCANDLDEGRYAAWPGYFTPDALYRVVPRENHDLGLPIALFHCEGHGMMADRVKAIEDAMMVRPRYLRRIVGDVRIGAVDDAGVRAQANVLLVETLRDRPTRIVLAGRYQDRFVRRDGRFLIAERLCVYDSLLIPDSLVEPV